MSVFIMYETMYYMYVYTVRTIVFLFIILYNYENLNKGKKAFKKIYILSFLKKNRHFRIHEHYHFIIIGTLSLS